MDSTNKLHVVMLPWLAFGHLIPFLELSKYLARKGHRISFLSTPRNIDRLPKLPSDLSPLVELVRLPRPHVDELPEDVEATADLPDESLRPYLSHVLDGLEEHLASFLAKATPDWIIHDYAAYWSSRVAAKFGVPCVYLSLFSAAVNTYIGPPAVLLTGDGGWKRQGDLTAAPEWIPFPSTVAFRPAELRELLRHQQHSSTDSSNNNQVSEPHRFGASVRGSDVVAIRTCREFEPEYLAVLEELYRPKRVIPVGFFPPLLDGDEIGTGGAAAATTPTTSVFDWLDKQAPASVVYVAFGTEARLSSEQVREIAWGLELSGFPFLWVLRGNLQMLPEGFEGRTNTRGIVWTRWVPQSRILLHPSIGGYLTHCGWNSIVEGLRSGLCLALLPMVFDQALNARLLVEKTAGVEVPRNEDDNSFTGVDIADTLELVIVGREEGEKISSRATELKGLFGDTELQDRYVTRFVEYLTKHRRQPAANWSEDMLLRDEILIS